MNTEQPNYSEGAPTPPDAPSLDQRLLHGIAWTLVAKWSAQVVSWGTIILLARILTPSDFGLLGLAALWLGLVEIVTEFGITSAVVTMHELDERQLRQLNTVGVLLGAVAFLMSIPVAPLLATFFNQTDLLAVIIVMSLAFVANSFRTIPNAILRRDMRFKLLSGLASAQAVATALVALGTALAGAGYWALVISNVFGATFGSGLHIICAGRGFSWPSFATLSSPLRYSRDVLSSNIAWYTWSNSDFLVAGKVLGQQALGFYTIAWTVASIPVEKFTAVIGGVTPSVFSAVQTDATKLRRYFRGISQGIGFVAFPLALGSAIVAPDLVSVVLGEQWIPAVPALQILALSISLRSISALPVQILTARRETRFVLKISLIQAGVLPVMFWLMSHWGITGIACGWIFVYPLISLLNFRRVLQVIEMPALEYLRAIEPPAISALVMAASVLALQAAIPGDTTKWISVACEILAGVIAYTIALVWLYRKAATGCLDFVLTLSK